MVSDSEIGQRLRARRTELDLTIRELARRTNLSASFISQVEKGKVKVSLDSLRSLAEQLDVSIRFFFPEPESTPPYINQAPPCEDDPDESGAYTPVVRAGCRPRLYFPDSGIRYELLGKELNRQMEAIYARLSPGKGNVARKLRKPTEEIIFVLSGVLLVGLDDQEYFLYPGDSIYFEGDRLSRLACASEREDAVWISIITPPVF
jgi:transcriptional regulator with XRE-family HTH domain